MRKNAARDGRYNNIAPAVCMIVCDCMMFIQIHTFDIHFIMYRYMNFFTYTV